MLRSSVIVFALLCGCGDRAVLIPPGQVVRLAEDTPAKIATYAGKDAAGNSVWNVAANRVTLPAGYFVAPPPATRPSK